MKEKQKETTETVVLHCNGASYEAQGYVSNNGFMVTKNSRVSDHTVDSFKKHVKSYADLREKLEEQGIITEGIFQEDYELKSPSAAASVIRGCASNGLNDWKTKEGTKLKDL